ncbi:MAG: tRNA pseudouridine(55) synthase TruB [Verrucomicrobia bacterium GWF2_62_7]|nr:MAG: tRNA pseudouridine(55) synthase TruB [Verrucomicrobia bacterium GWF2_62_7]
MIEFTPFDGVLLVDKPTAWTSHDVVAKVRAHFGFKKVGHCGTLDPMATGLLVLVLGRATRLSEKLTSDDKAYDGTILLGVTTNTEDADGKPLETKPVPPLTEADLQAVLQKFRGDIYQTPPMVSAIKHQGRPLYKLARKGIEVEREPRLVHIYDLRLLGMELPRVKFRMACSKGTYVRTLAADIGRALGCGAHLAELRRTAAGSFKLEQAHTLEQILAQPRAELTQWIMPILDVARLIKP